MEPFKNNIHPGTVQDIAGLISGAWDRDGFVASATDGLEQLELKQRIVHVADALAAALPDDYPSALALVLANVPEGPQGTDRLTSAWAYWPLCTFVERHGLAHPDLSLDAMERLTPHWSCEFAVRPYFAADPAGVLTRIERWSRHDSVHVRRLASEGTRPRLPWGQRLAHRIEQPEAMLPVLERLRDDPDEYVRRSVANHLNDIAKDHPDLLLRVAKQWLSAPPTPAPAARVKLVKHALRTLIKAGDARAYALIGLQPFDGQVVVGARPDRVVAGDTITLDVTLTSTSAQAQRLRLDLGVHHRLKNGQLSPKVFHWTVRTIKAGETLVLTKAHKIRIVTVRRLYPGTQAIDLRVNGIATPAQPFELDL